MSYNRRTSLGYAAKNGYIDRSATQGGLPNNSNIGSFAAHKVNKHDKTNASHNPMVNWLSEAPAKGRQRGSTKQKKGKNNDALEFEKDFKR